MEENRSWGALWTYALVIVGSLFLIGAIWLLVEDRRDNDAAAFYKVSKQNQNQIMGVRGYVLAMPDGQAKTDLKAMLDTVHIVSTRAEVEALNPVETDSVPPPAPPTPRINDISFENINTTWATVVVDSEYKSQAVARYATVPGEYFGEGQKEMSFNYSNHHLRIGNNTNYAPLVPGTTYYVKVICWYEDGTVEHSVEKSVTLLP